MTHLERAKGRETSNRKYDREKVRLTLLTLLPVWLPMQIHLEVQKSESTSILPLVFLINLENNCVHPTLLATVLTMLHPLHELISGSSSRVMGVSILGPLPAHYLPVKTGPLSHYMYTRVREQEKRTSFKRPGEKCQDAMGVRLQQGEERTKKPGRMVWQEFSRRRNCPPYSSITTTACFSLQSTTHTPLKSHCLVAKRASKSWKDRHRGWTIWYQ